MWATGRNYQGQLGTGDKENRNVWVKVLNNVKYIKAGYIHGGYVSFAIKKDGTAWATGYNKEGQLGTGDNKDRNVWVKILDDVIYIKKYYAIKSDWTLWRNNGNKWIKILDNVKYVSDEGWGKGHEIIIKNDNTAWVRGSNNWGQLGIDNSKGSQEFIKIFDNVIYALAYGYSSYVIKSDGSLWVTGKNECGELGLGIVNYYIDKWEKVLDNVKLVVVDADGGFDLFCSFALQNDGTLWATGYNGYLQLGIKNK